MKKTRLKLDELRIESFVTSVEQQEKVKGGTITTIFFLLTRGDNCPAYSEDELCTISA